MLPGLLVIQGCSGVAGSSAANHEVATLSVLESLSDSEINNAKSKLVIAYGHTSHGSQIDTGLDGLVEFMNGRGRTNNLYDGLDLRCDMGGYGSAYGASDLNQSNYGDWVDATRLYLSSHSEINVVIWSWCAGVSHADETIINTYLSDMTQLESDYPDIVFVYMTGHLDGTGVDGNLNLRNEQIRDYCRDNNKVLFDFADIESYDPDGLVNYMGLLCTDNCDYDSNGDGSQDTNWATVWQTANPGEWYSCSPEHTQALNANMKAYAFWYLMVQIANRM
ncbi:MAG TPA: hypothetical protein PK514_12970 [Spirochaetota bacterium]|nr:hypothetical protein [Spirochaetota bacterium]